MRLWIRGLISRREGVKHPTRLRYSVGTFCLIYLVLIHLLILKIPSCLVFGYFYLIWKDESFAYLPLKKKDQNQVVHSQKIIFGGLD